MSNLNQKQKNILQFIENYYLEYGISPSIREIQKGCNITSTSVVDYNLKSLQRNGYLNKRSDISRAIKLNKNVQSVKIPIISNIAAGEPLMVNPDYNSFNEDTDPYVELPNNIQNEPGLYALKVKGDSMIDALIASDDIVIMKPDVVANNGEMIAAWLPDNEETTLKRFYFTDNKVELRPENSNYDSLFLDPKDVIIKGKVVGVIRKV
ncbi:MAG: repressor LexA [Chloroflexi bacterium]|nr:repressor LexA [Chloroflexota bacterium]MBO98945.1 repressor LexA [Chloroflexota bacterium]|tara:strand:+ start:322 stop:945 length:624 start_codon:yes stop_codon:yes gene_type:complete